MQELNKDAVSGPSRVSPRFPDLAQLMGKVMEGYKDDPAYVSLAYALKHGDTSLFYVDSFDEAEALLQELDKNGVSCTATAAYKNDVYLIVLNEDLEKAQEIIRGFYQTQNVSGLCSAAYLNAYAQGNIKEIKGLSSEEANLFVLRCQEHGIPINVVGPTSETYHIRYAGSDAVKIEHIRLDTSVSMYGPAGDLYKKHLAWKDHYDMTVMNMIITGEYPDGHPLPAGCSVVDEDGRRIEIGKHYISFYESPDVPGKRIFRYAGGAEHDKNMEEVSHFVKTFMNPVFLDTQANEQLKKTPEEQVPDYLVERRREGLVLPKDMYIEELARSACEYRSPDHEKMHIGDSIVDVSGDQIVFGENSVSFITHGQTDAKIEEKIAELICKMSEPVFLTAAQMTELKHKEDLTDFIRKEELSAREYVPGQPELSAEDLRQLAKAESMRHVVEVHLKHDGIELPKTELMTYHDASMVFGLAAQEEQAFNVAMQQDFVSEFDEDDISDVVNQVESHFGLTSPTTPTLALEDEILADHLIFGDEMIADPDVDDRSEHDLFERETDLWEV